MKMKKVSVDINDPRKIAPVVLFLDQEEVQQQIEKIRKLFNFSKITFPYTEYENAIKNIKYKPSDEEEQHYKDMNAELMFLGTNYGYSDSERERSLYNEIQSWEIPFNHLLRHIDDLLRNWTVGEEFRQILIKAVVCNEVHDKDYKGRSDPGVVRNIIRDREWFWQNRRYSNSDRKSYHQIFMTSPLMPKKDAKTVEQAVRSYERRLLNFKKNFFSPSLITI